MRLVLTLAALALALLALLAWAHESALDSGSNALEASGALHPEEGALAPSPIGDRLTGAPSARPDAKGTAGTARAEQAQHVRTAPDGWSARITGILVDERTGRPLPYARVRLPEHAAGPGDIETDRDGRFTSAKPYEAGRVEISLGCAGPRGRPRWTAHLWHHPESAHAEQQHRVRGGPTWRLDLTLDDAARRVGRWDARVFLDPEQQPGLPDDPNTEPGFLVSRHAPRLRSAGSGAYLVEEEPAYPYELGSVFRREGAWYAAFPPVPQLLSVDGPYILELYGGEVQASVRSPRLDPFAGSAFRARAPLTTLDGGGLLALRPLGLGALELTVVDDEGALIETGLLWLAAAGSRLQPEGYQCGIVRGGQCSIGELGPGGYAVHVRAPGHSPARAELHVRVDEATEHRFVLVRARQDGRITGALTSDTGLRDGADQVRITPVRADDRGSEPYITNVPVVWSTEQGKRVGRFLREGLPPGEYEIEVIGGYLQPWSHTQRRVHTTQGTVDFHLADEDSADVLVRVLAAETRLPLSEARVSVMAGRGFRERSFGRAWKGAEARDGLLVLRAVGRDARLEIEAAADGREKVRVSRSDLQHEVRADGGQQLVAEFLLHRSQD